MCTYTDALYRCGCCGPPVCYTSCSHIMSELDRINHPEAWEGDGLTQLPFDMADECVPNWHNAILVPEEAVCDHYLGGGCLPEQRVPDWLASTVVWPDQTLEGLVNNVEWLENHVDWQEYNVGWSEFGVEWTGDNAEWQGYNFASPEYNSILPEDNSSLPGYGPAWSEYGPPWPTYDPTND
ncbi:hypothetical protein CCMA1212_001547 [Trichoderma ghanense]|uniref:SSCRP protein n=1 Tax=Trichoderma ghanense TaxID=65468 RepID=A0ABY2HF81_9HYPO